MLDLHGLKSWLRNTWSTPEAEDPQSCGLLTSHTDQMESSCDRMERLGGRRGSHRLRRRRHKANDASLESPDNPTAQSSWLPAIIEDPRTQGRPSGKGFVPAIPSIVEQALDDVALQIGDRPFDKEKGLERLRVILLCPGVPEYCRYLKEDVRMDFLDLMSQGSEQLERGLALYLRYLLRMRTGDRLTPLADFACLYKEEAPRLCEIACQVALEICQDDDIESRGDLLTTKALLADELGDTVAAKQLLLQAIELHNTEEQRKFSSYIVAKFYQDCIQ